MGRHQEALEMAVSGVGRFLLLLLLAITAPSFSSSKQMRRYDISDFIQRNHGDWWNGNRDLHHFLPNVKQLYVPVIIPLSKWGKPEIEAARHIPGRRRGHNENRSNRGRRHHRFHNL